MRCPGWDSSAHRVRTASRPRVRCRVERTRDAEIGAWRRAAICGTVPEADPAMMRAVAPDAPSVLIANGYAAPQSYLRPNRYSLTCARSATAAAPRSSASGHRSPAARWCRAGASTASRTPARPPTRRVRRRTRHRRGATGRLGVRACGRIGGVERARRRCRPCWTAACCADPRGAVVTVSHATLSFGPVAGGCRNGHLHGPGRDWQHPRLSDGDLRRGVCGAGNDICLVALRTDIITDRHITTLKNSLGTPW